MDIPPASTNEKRGAHLTLAAMRGDAKRVKELLCKGYSPDTIVDGQTALQWSADAKTAECSALLLAAGADPNLCPDVKSDAPPICLGACREDPALLLALLRAGALPDTPNYAGETPLILAAHFGHAECVEALLEAGARPALADCDGITAVMVARASGFDGIAAAIEARELSTSLAAAPGKPPLRM